MQIENGALKALWRWTVHRPPGYTDRVALMAWPWPHDKSQHLSLAFWEALKFDAES